MLLGCLSCNHEAVPDNNGNNRMIPVRTGGKSASQYVAIVNMGHDAKGCPGCILYNGRYIHVDCQGHGTACHVSATVMLNQSGADVTAVTVDTFDLTSENFFAMPDRSLEYIDANNEKIYLNIPAQTVYRDTATLQFTFTGLYFSSTAAYSNN